MRKHPILVSILCLEILALALALAQMSVGLVSDEAKYLLSISYPHPPLLRSILGWTASMPMHEFFWRFVFASFLLQAVWFVWDLGDVLTRPRRIVLAASWLLSSAVIVQSGMIVMATASALSGLLFLWWTLHPAPPKKPAMLACLWLVALFSSYQSFLFAPLVFSALWRFEKSRMKIFLYFILPIVLLAFYSLTNPYALVLMFKISGQDMVLPFMERFTNIAWVWILAGSGLLSIIGTIGIVSSVRLDLVAAFGMLLGYIVLSSASYYAILFTPLLIGGLFLLFCKRRLHPGLFIAGQAVCTVLIVILAFPEFKTTPSRAEMRALMPHAPTGTVIIDGFFGHDWQYESPLPVRKFNQELSALAEAKAGVFICTKESCEENVNDELWVRAPDMPLPTWLKKGQ